jgi:5-methylcytosine-specific restriction endonuclease McrA
LWRLKYVANVKKILIFLVFIRTKANQANKQWYKDNSEYVLKQQKQYYDDNAENRLAYSRRYYGDNLKQINKQNKIRLERNALFKSYFKQLEVFEEIRPCPENLKLLEVKCAYCGKWMKPTNLQIQNRLQVFNGQMSGECRFYCSENCKQSCPTFNQILWPRGFKKATSREVVPLLRQLVLERDAYTCQKCGATTETAQLHVHHEKSYTLNKIMANDPDNCITLCKECHKEIHLRKGCTYNDLKC